MIELISCGAVFLRSYPCLICRTRVRVVTLSYPFYSWLYTWVVEWLPFLNWFLMSAFLNQWFFQPPRVLCSYSSNSCGCPHSCGYHLAVLVNPLSIVHGVNEFCFCLSPSLFLWPAVRFLARVHFICLIEDFSFLIVSGSRSWGLLRLWLYLDLLQLTLLLPLTLLACSWRLFAIVLCSCSCLFVVLLSLVVFFSWWLLSIRISDDPLFVLWWTEYGVVI